MALEGRATRIAALADAGISVAGGVLDVFEGHVGLPGQRQEGVAYGVGSDPRRQFR